MIEDFKKFAIFPQEDMERWKKQDEDWRRKIISGFSVISLPKMERGVEVVNSISSAEETFLENIYKL